MITPLLVHAIARFSRSDPFFSPLSSCSHCNFQDFKVWFPLIGYLLSRGRCQSCQQPLSTQPMVIGTLVFVSTILFSILHSFSWLLLSDLLFVYTAILLGSLDWNTQTIDIRIVSICVMLRIGWILVFDLSSLPHYLAGWLMGAGGLYWISLIYEALRNTRGLGEGDASILGLVGLWIGWSHLISVLLIASVTGLIIGGTWVILQKKSIHNTTVPFAPFLFIGGILVYLWQDQSFQSYYFSFFS